MEDGFRVRYDGFNLAYHSVCPFSKINISFTMAFSSFGWGLISVRAHDVTGEMEQGCFMQMVRSPITELKLSPRVNQKTRSAVEWEMSAAQVWVRRSRVVSRPPQTTGNVSVPAIPLQILARCGPASTPALEWIRKHGVPGRNKDTPWGTTFCSATVHKIQIYFL